MNKKAMSLVTLLIAVTVMIMLASVMTMGASNINVKSKIMDDMDLENFQQLANMAYAGIYFDNLTHGIRRELTAEEIRTRMIKDGADANELIKYSIVVKNGDVFVNAKGE